MSRFFKTVFPNVIDLFPLMQKCLVIIVLLLNCIQGSGQQLDEDFLLENSIVTHGGIERLDTTKKQIFLCFTGHKYNDGGHWIRKTLKRQKIPAHFFFTGDFYRSGQHRKLIKKLIKDGHYLGAHSDKHLLYASWQDRDSLLINKATFSKDLADNYEAMRRFGIIKAEALFFMPPYEWYNRQISSWTKEMGFVLINYSPGSTSNADYTTPDMGKRYKSSDVIYNNILKLEAESAIGLNGFILLVHIGTHPDRTDKFYFKLPQLIQYLEGMGYSFKSLVDFFD
jgi:peptidoglycan/xylan/chitin deacetylase (PgdA/CDA1 family)